MSADLSSTNQGGSPAGEPTGTVPSESGHASGGESAAHRRKTIVGTVSSDRMRKTRSVQIQRLVKHPKYGKFIRRRTTFYAHDEDEVSHLGDTVLIAETRPLSKLKRWRLVRVITKSASGPVVPGDLEGSGGSAEPGPEGQGAGDGGGSQ